MGLKKLQARLATAQEAGDEALISKLSKKIAQQQAPEQEAQQEQEAEAVQKKKKKKKREEADQGGTAGTGGCRWTIVRACSSLSHACCCYYSISRVWYERTVCIRAKSMRL